MMQSLGLSNSVVKLLCNISEPQIRESDITNSDDHAVNVIFSEFGLMLCESGRLDPNGSR